MTSLDPSGYLAPREPKWFVSCLDGAFYNSTVHAKSAWADKEGRVWVDSARFDVIGWVEEAYGEKGATRAMEIDYTNLSLDEVQTRMKTFPWVYDRIETYRRVLSDASDRTGISLTMVCEGKPGAIWLLFRGRAHVDFGGGVELELRKTIEALKEAYDLTEREPAYRR